MTRLTHSSEPVIYIHNKLDLSNVIVFNLIDANKYQYQYQYQKLISDAISPEQIQVPICHILYGILDDA